MWVKGILMGHSAGPRVHSTAQLASHRSDSTTTSKLPLSGGRSRGTGLGLGLGRHTSLRAGVHTVFPHRIVQPGPRSFCLSRVTSAHTTALAGGALIWGPAPAFLPDCTSLKEASRVRLMICADLDRDHRKGYGKGSCPFCTTRRDVALPRQT